MKEKINTMDLNVVILPDEATSERLIALSCDLSERIDAHFILDDSNFRPHLSLFPNQYPIRNRRRIESVLRDLSQHTEPFKVVLTGYSQISGFIFADAVRTDELVALHTKAVEVLNPIREGHTPALVATLKSLSPAQQACVEQYGNPIVLDAWEPHVTLTHIDNLERAKAVLTELPLINLEFGVDAIHLSRFGQWGTCPEILESFSLGE